jgi:hypothetical protein
MFNTIVILFLVLGTSTVYSLLLDEQPDSSVLQLLVKLEADVNSNKAQLKELQEACTCSGTAYCLNLCRLKSIVHFVKGDLMDYWIFGKTFFIIIKWDKLNHLP